MNSLGGVTKISFMGEEMRRPLRGENCLDAKTVFCTWSKTIGRSARRYNHITTGFLWLKMRLPCASLPEAAERPEAIPLPKFARKPRRRGGLGGW